MALRPEPAERTANVVEDHRFSAGARSGRRVSRVSDRDSPASLHRLEPGRLGDHVDRLYRAAWALCGRREDAEGLVQETYALVLAKPRWLSRDDDLAYLLRVLRNTYVSGVRARGRRPAEVPFDDHAEPVSRCAGWSTCPRWC